TGVILVPQVAVLQNPASAYVYVVNSKNKIEVSRITLGNWYDSQWLIEKGLKAGDKVVVNYLTKLKPGMQVKPQVVTAKSVINKAAGKKKNTDVGKGKTPETQKKDSSLDNKKNQPTEKKNNTVKNNGAK